MSVSHRIISGRGVKIPDHIAEAASGLHEDGTEYYFQEIAQKYQGLSVVAVGSYYSGGLRYGVFYTNTLVKASDLDGWADDKNVVLFPGDRMEMDKFLVEIGADVVSATNLVGGFWS